MDKREAIKAFANDFNFIEKELIKYVCNNTTANFIELTPRLYIGNEVTYIDNVTGIEEVGCISEIDNTNNRIVVNGKIIDIYDIYTMYNGFFPIYGTFFNPKELEIGNWIENNLEKVAKCGFRIYKYEETGSIYLGIDGCGYDFYKEHWEPLYDAIGIKCHDFKKYDFKEEK